MYSPHFYDPYHYPRDLRETHPAYDFESYHPSWHPEDLMRERELDLIRERELEELRLANHELDLELDHIQLERERAMTLNDPYRFAHTSGIHPGYQPLEPYSMGYGGSHLGYTAMNPPIPLVNEPVYRPSIPLVDDPLYHTAPPRSAPMMDPYFLNTIMPIHAPVEFPINPIRNPFAYGVDHDYGYGPIKPLSQYGLVPTALQPDFGYILDDLYLYEMLLRLDKTLHEQERLLRWQERLAWEQLDHAERQLRWEQMDMMERNRLGLGPGSRWGHVIGGIPINTNFGYLSPALGPQLMECYRPLGQAPIMGVCGQPHYPIPPALMSQFPIWDVGGLGLGARVSRWIDEFGCVTPKNMIRRENMLRDYAERRGEIPLGPRVVDPYTGYM